MSRPYSSLSSLSKRGSLFHRQYRYINLPLVSDATIESKCQCYCEGINSILKQDDQLNPRVEMPKKVPFYRRHVLVVSPKDQNTEDTEWKSKWQTRLETNPIWPYSLIGSLKEHLKHSRDGSGILVNAISMVRGDVAPTESSSSDVAHVFVIPDMKVYKIHRHEVREFANYLSGGPLNVTQKPTLSFADYLKGANNIQVTQKSEASGSALTKPPFDFDVNTQDWVLICGHYQRDQRCGLIAQDLLKEIKTKNLFPNTNVALISHVGGHKYAGNVILYNQVGSTEDHSKTKLDCLWFGKVLPPNLPILSSRLQEGEIPQELFRGGLALN